MTETSEDLSLRAAVCSHTIIECVPENAPNNQVMRILQAFYGFCPVCNPSYPHAVFFNGIECRPRTRGSMPGVSRPS